MYYSAIGTLALLILLIENQDVFLNRGDTFKKTAWMIYRRFLFAVGAYYVTDILWGIIESHKMPGMFFADTTAYYLAMAASILFWTDFSFAYIYDNDRKGGLVFHAGRIISISVALMAVVNIFTPVLFVVDSSCVYKALTLRYVMLVIQIIHITLISIYVFSAVLRRRGSREQRIRFEALGGFSVIMAVCLFAQLWNPYLPLYAIAFMLGTAMFRALVVNNEKEEYRRELKDASRVKELKDTIISLLNNVPAMTYTKDAATGVYLACNQAFAEYAHKKNPDEVVGLAAREIFDPETARLSAEDDRMALSMDEPYIFVEDVRDAAGNRRQLQTTKLKYTDTLGRNCILGICQDVTDTTRIQRESATTKEAYERARSTGIIHTHIAQALARGYSDLYYINIETGEYIEYRPDENGTLTEFKRKDDFFGALKQTAGEIIYSEDVESVLEAMDRETLKETLDRNSSLMMTFRYQADNEPVYVTMKVSRMQDDDRFIVIGITNVDDEMKQKRAADRMLEEQIAYGRINALSGDYICIYIVDPVNDHYREFSASTGYESLGVEKEGDDFFDKSRKNTMEIVCPEDRGRVVETLTKEHIMAEIESHGFFSMRYRIIMEGEPVYIQLKAVMADEEDGKCLLVGINDIDAQVRREKEYVRNLAQARTEANVDALTGVKNRHAFLMAEERINLQIEEGQDPEFAVVFFDVNDLKKVNDTKGHNAGDKYLQNACKVVCEVFDHSPVFRVGGDEFAVIAQGSDYEHIDELVAEMNEYNKKAKADGGIVIACGMARYEGDSDVASVFERADHNMYGNKTQLKEGIAGYSHL
jgi:diguanylate cyclase (GGDEF)-like protein